jgi:hypothetical protein
MWLVSIDNNQLGQPFKSAHFPTVADVQAAGLYPCNYGDYDPAQHMISGVLVDGGTVIYDIQPLPATVLLERYKVDAVERIRKDFEAALAAGYTCANGITMDAELEKVSMLKMGMELAQRNNQVNMYLVDYGNTLHPEIPVADVNTMLTELGINYATQHRKKNDLRTAIMAAESMAGLDAVIWE